VVEKPLPEEEQKEEKNLLFNERQIIESLKE